MKKNSLTTAVVAGIAGVAGFAGLANAVNLNQDGVGQALIYPYYTVNKSQDTLISVVNTADVGKAVKVRFLEGYNSREVLDFNLFLSPHDVWTAVVNQVSDEGGAQINTFDESCIDILPHLPYAFSSAAYTGAVVGAGVAYPKDSGPQGIDRTREGYIEMLLMGDIIPNSALDKDTTHKQTGVAGAGVPACTLMGNNATIGAGIGAPTGGLFGGGAIVNVGEGTFFAYSADAVDGWRETSSYSPSLALTPTLKSAATPSIVDTGVARAYVFTEGGALLTADYDRGEDAVSAVFMADAIYNEYFINQSFGASSDWVLTFPTKRFYVDKGLYASAITSPFAEKFAFGESNVELSLKVYDQEEGTPVPGTVPGCPSPPVAGCFDNPDQWFAPFEVNVLSFINPGEAVDVSNVLGSNLALFTPGYGTAGWARINLADGDDGVHVLEGGVTPAGEDVVLPGLPITGFYANNVINVNAAPGRLANYSGVWRHRAQRSCVGADAACS